MGQFLFLSNESSRDHLNEEVDAVAFVNESVSKHGSGGWVQLAPYGVFPNADGLQRFEKVDAEEIVNRFTSLVPYANEPIAVKAARMTVGLPFFIGHPDHPRFSDKYKDERAYGRIKQLEARDDALWANVKWSEEGKKLIESEAFHGHSVNWGCVKENGHVRPRALKSVGFTNSPAIPVLPIETANIANEKEKTMNEMLKWILNALGLEETSELQAMQEKFNVVANEAKAAKEAGEKLASAEAKLKEASEKQVALANEKAADAEKAKKIEADLTNERARAERAEATYKGKDTEIANERKQFGNALLKMAIETGRITLAESKKAEVELANEFSKTLDRITKLPVKIHVISVTATRNQGNDSKRDATEKLIANIHADMRADPGLTYAGAWEKREREHPDEFAAAFKADGN